jgi:NCS2 family nucleobase:cation symporter-2
VRWAEGGDPAAPDFGASRNLGLAFAVFGAILLYSRLLTGLLRNLSVLLGLATGTLLALALGMAHFGGVLDAGWLGVTTPFAFGRPTFDLPSIASMTVVMIVVMVETTGDCVAVGEIVGRPLSPNDLARALRADGLSTMLGGVLNAFPYTAYAQNVGLVGLTRVKSRFAVAAAGAILMALGLLPKVAAVVASIPPPVLGGAGLIMFGTVAASGIRALTRVEFEGSHNALVVAGSLAVGLIPLGDAGFYRALPGWSQVILHSGITTGSAAAIGLNALLAPRR